jgi:hypothetical protein
LCCGGRAGVERRRLIGLGLLCEEGRGGGTLLLFGWGGERGRVVVMAGWADFVVFGVGMGLGGVACRYGLE